MWRHGYTLLPWFLIQSSCWEVSCEDTIMPFTLRFLSKNFATRHLAGNIARLSPSNNIWKQVYVDSTSKFFILHKLGFNKASIIEPTSSKYSKNNMVFIQELSIGYGYESISFQRHTRTLQI